MVSEEDEKRARRKAEGLDREKRAREERKRRKRRKEEEEEGKVGFAAADKAKEKRKRREGGHGRRDGDVGPSRRQAGEGHKSNKQDVAKAGKTKV